MGKLVNYVNKFVDGIFKFRAIRSRQLGWLEPRGIGTGPADPAAAGPKFAVIIIAPTIKSSNYYL